MSSVTGIFSNNSQVIETEELAKLLFSFNILQDHRGQAGSGVVTANSKRIKKPLKDRGPARTSTPYSQLSNISDHTTFAGIAHTCYAKNQLFHTRENIHPIPIHSKKFDIYVVSDGILLDKDDRMEGLKNKGYKFGSNTNGAVIGLGDKIDARQMASLRDGRSGYLRTRQARLLQISISPTHSSCRLHRGCCQPSRYI